MEGGMETIRTDTAKQDEEEREEIFWKVRLPPTCMHFVDSPDSDSFSRLVSALECPMIIAMDAEWKPFLHGSGSAGAHLPRMSIFQIACRVQSHKGATESGLAPSVHVLTTASEPKSNTLRTGDETDQGGKSSEKEVCPRTALEGHKSTGEEETKTCSEMIFLLDLLALPVAAFSKVLKKVLIDPAVLKFGFGFRQDLWHLHGTFPGPDLHGCFDKVEPYLHVGKLFRHLHGNKSRFISRGRRIVIDGEYSLTSISEKILGLPLSKAINTFGCFCGPCLASTMVFLLAVYIWPSISAPPPAVWPSSEWGPIPLLTAAFRVDPVLR